MPRALLNSIIKQQPYQQLTALAWTRWAALALSSAAADSLALALDKRSQKSHDIRGSYQLVSIVTAYRAVYSNAYVIPGLIERYYNL